nr:MAG TPA: hypothetical protein [Caudoviricetes sp.]
MIWDKLNFFILVLLYHYATKVKLYFITYK